MHNSPAKRTAACSALFVILTALLSPSAQAQEEEVLDEIVAKVNNEVITLSDLKTELKALRSSLRGNYETPEQLEKAFQEGKRDLLKNIIENKLLLQRAEDLGMGANIESDVEAQLEEMRKKSGIPDLQVFDEILQRQGSSLISFRESIRQRLTIDMLLQRMVYARITLLTPEIQAHYEENLSRFTLPAEVELAEILILKEGADPAQSRRKAGQVRARLMAGGSFEALAKEHSEGPTASREGLIGTFRKGSMATNLEQVSFALEVGAISAVVESDYGFQILKLLDKKESRRRPLDEVRQEIQGELYRMKAQPELREFINSLRADGYIYVAPSYQEEFEVSELVTS